MIDKSSGLDSLRKKLQKSLNHSRYGHTLRVVDTAVFLATIHDVDLYKTRVAALLHDCAKNMQNQQILDFCQTHGLELPKEAHCNPDLIHAKVGALVAKVRYNVHDQNILNAIAYHTTGRPEMTPLEKVIYIADYIEPSRDKAPHLDIIRKTAKTSLNDALSYIMKDTIYYLKSQDKYIDPLTIKAYSYYCKDVIK